MGTKDDKQHADHQTNLVWTRYNSLIVANAILIGFISQAKLKFGIPACVFGIILALVWFFITSYGWSLAHAYLEGEPKNTKYDKWIKDKWGEKPQDPIWWFAHIVIALFYLGYILLGFRYLLATDPSSWVIGCGLGIIIISVIILLVAFCYSLVCLKIRETPNLRENGGRII